MRRILIQMQRHMGQIIPVCLAKPLHRLISPRLQPLLVPLAWPLAVGPEKIGAGRNDHLHIRVLGLCRRSFNSPLYHRIKSGLLSSRPMKNSVQMGAARVDRRRPIRRSVQLVSSDSGNARRTHIADIHHDIWSGPSVGHHWFFLSGIV